MRFVSNWFKTQLLRLNSAPPKDFRVGVSDTLISFSFFMLCPGDFTHPAERGHENHKPRIDTHHAN